MRTFPPKEHQQLAHILNGWVQTAQQYGFSQYKTPILNPFELYVDKTSQEIVKNQMYSFTDRGNREVVLRPEITPGTASMLVTLQNDTTFISPFKGFTIGSVFRYENPQKGRTREHIQFNADIFGADDAWAEAEIIDLAFAALESMQLPRDGFSVRLNDRSNMEMVLATVGIDSTSLHAVLRLLDKREKMKPKEFKTALEELTEVPLSAIDKALANKPERVAKVMDLLPDSIQALYDPSVVRGFDYYTGIVFEIFARDTSIATRSVAGGGRYDSLIASYGGGSLPAVGFGMGDTILYDCFSAFNVETKLAEAPIVMCVEDTATLATGYAVSQKIRKHLPTSFVGVISEKKLSAKYKKYDAISIKHVIHLAADEITFSIRNLHTRETSTYTKVDDVIAHLTTS